MIPIFVLPSLRDSKQRIDKLHQRKYISQILTKFDKEAKTNASLIILTHDSRRHFKCCGLDGLETSCTASPEWFKMYHHHFKNNIYNNISNTIKHAYA